MTSCGRFPRTNQLISERNFMKRSLGIFVTVLVLVSAVVAQEQRFAIDDMMKVRRLSDPQVSPDGRQVAFVIGDVQFDDNRTVNQIYVVPIGGGEPKQLTKGGSSSSQPRWSPDGKKIAFVTGGQIWVMDADGDDKEQVTKLSRS